MSKRKKEKAKEPLTPERGNTGQNPQAGRLERDCFVLYQADMDDCFHGFAVWSILRNYSHEKQ